LGVFPKKGGLKFSQKEKISKKGGKILEKQIINFYFFFLSERNPPGHFFQNFIFEGGKNKIFFQF
jgi:hypothetical protein